MSKNSHVPKFGNWDSDNVPYTTYFENARNQKSTSKKIMNPNDPEENPDAFNIEPVLIEENEHVIRPPPSRHNSGKLTHIYPFKKENNSYSSNSEERITRHTVNAHQTGSMDHHNSGRRKSPRSELGSDQSSSDLSLVQRHARSNQKKSSGDSSSSFSSVSPATRVRNHLVEKTDHRNHRAASVPKFGTWDETDPRSGEGFTVIFNKVKEEKQIGISKGPIIPPLLPPPPSKGRNAYGNLSPRPKRCCGWF